QEVLVDPMWVPTGAMSHTHAAHATSLLADGRLLVIAGFNGSAFIFDTEVYNPTTNVWSPAAPELFARAGGQAALLPNGKVIVAGGFDGGVACLAPTDLYDP